MPVKRRAPKSRTGYPPLIEQLLNGEEIEHTEEVHQELIAVAYFGWAEGIPAAALKRAAEVIAKWCDWRDITSSD
jgi:hypothetical protein